MSDVLCGVCSVLSCCDLLRLHLVVLCRVVFWCVALLLRFRLCVNVRSRARLRVLGCGRGRGCVCARACAGVCLYTCVCV